MAPAIYVKRIIDIAMSKDDRNATVTLESNEIVELVFPEKLFRSGLLRANAVLAEHDHPARVVPIKRIKLDG